MNANALSRVGAALIGAVGALHLALAPEYLGEQAYVGGLFIAGGIAALWVAVKLWRAPTLPAWGMGALISAGMAVGFVLSRTLGLPGFHEAEWEASGVLSVLLELGFVGVAAIGARDADRNRSALATG